MRQGSFCFLTGLAEFNAKNPQFMMFLNPDFSLTRCYPAYSRLKPVSRGLANVKICAARAARNGVSKIKSFEILSPFIRLC